jgi:hypothetical protein
MSTLKISIITSDVKPEAFTGRDWIEGKLHWLTVANNYWMMQRATQTARDLRLVGEGNAHYRFILDSTGVGYYK